MRKYIAVPEKVIIQYRVDIDEDALEKAGYESVEEYLLAKYDGNFHQAIEDDDPIILNAAHEQILMHEESDYANISID